jgi:hypothetical protein
LQINFTAELGRMLEKHDEKYASLFNEIGKFLKS